MIYMKVLVPLAMILCLAIVFISWGELDEEPHHDIFSRFKAQVNSEKPSNIKKSLEKVEASSPVKNVKKEIIKKIKARGPLDIPSNQERRFKALCQVFLRENLSDDDLLIDPSSDHFKHLSKMYRQLTKVKKNFERLVNRGRTLKSKHVCAANEFEKYLTTLMDSLRRHKISRTKKRQFILTIFDISSLQLTSGQENFSLYMMYKLVEYGLLSQDFMSDLSRLQKDHNILMEMKYGQEPDKELVVIERQKFVSDINALTRLMIRTLY